jgi:hypothetical protein
MNRRIHVIMRMCPDSQAPLSGNSSRPPWFQKEAVFRTVFDSKDEQVDFLILFDGDSSNHWIKKYPVPTVEIKAGSGDASFEALLQVIISIPFQENDIIYILEDDYVHREGWPKILREGFGEQRPKHISFDYLSLYDHLDKYEFANDAFLIKSYSDLKAQLTLSESVHWRTVPSTTNTFAMTMKTFKDDFRFHMLFKNNDHDKFLFLGLRGRKLATCIPGYSTHCHKDYMTPFVDWEKIIRPKFS